MKSNDIRMKMGYIEEHLLIESIYINENRQKQYVLKLNTIENYKNTSYKN